MGLIHSREPIGWATSHSIGSVVCSFRKIFFILVHLSVESSIASVWLLLCYSNWRWVFLLLSHWFALPLAMTWCLFDVCFEMVKRNFAQKRNLFCNFDFEIEIPRFSEEVKNPDLFRKSKLATSSLVFGLKACQRPEWNHKSYFLVFLTWFIEFQLRFWIINSAS